jgi:stress-induced morphogen
MRSALRQTLVLSETMEKSIQRIVSESHLHHGRYQTEEATQRATITSHTASTVRVYSHHRGCRSLRADSHTGGNSAAVAAVAAARTSNAGGGV